MKRKKSIDEIWLQQLYVDEIRLHRAGAERKYPHDSLVCRDRMNSIILELSNTEKLGGACAEVGVYKGGTAELIALNKKERPLYLFDTFAGIPHSGEHDNYCTPGLFDDTSFAKVHDRLIAYRKVSIHRGIFPQDTGYIVDNIKFSFVHLDVDVYKSYIDALSVFWPKMIKNGVVICDDYGSAHCLGAKAAIDEFFESRSERDASAWLVSDALVIMKL